jgi:hypothetical protein
VYLEMQNEILIRIPQSMPEVNETLDHLKKHDREKQKLKKTNLYQPPIKVMGLFVSVAA